MNCTNSPRLVELHGPAQIHRARDQEEVMSEKANPIYLGSTMCQDFRYLLKSWGGGEGEGKGGSSIAIFSIFQMKKLQLRQATLLARGNM